MSCCIAGLTRGYEDISKYSQLINRNISIEKHLNNKNIDILIFHEGNITDSQQTYIKQKTPSLKIIFINILSGAFKESKSKILFSPETKSFNLGYRHMCDFWFVSFWSFVQNYDYLLRIDEDCVMNTNIDIIFYNLQEYGIICAKYDTDEVFVTRGLNEFTLNFINTNPNYEFKHKKKKISGGPYTNLFGISLDKLRNNEMLQKYIQEIDNSNMIYERRWGDLPLWGEVICYIIGYPMLFIDNTIQYFHGSHNLAINYKSTPIVKNKNKNKNNNNNKNNKNNNNNNNKNNNNNINQLRQMRIRQMRIRQMKIRQMKIRQMKIRQMKIRQMKIRQMKIKQMKIKQLINKI
jgi:hypothetical protein